METTKRTNSAGIALLCTLLTAPSARAVTFYESEAINLYTQGYFTAHEVNAGNRTRLQDGASRVGVGLNTFPYNAWTAGFYLEWGLRLISSYRPLVFQPSASGPTTSLYLRQGNGFAEHETWGKFTLGKQWGVYYDITQITDAFNVSGALASGTFTLGTDGGFTGTGRADSALSWRKHWHWLNGTVQLGLQYATPSAQLEVATGDLIGDDRLIAFPSDSSENGTNHGVSLTYKGDLGDGLFLGATFNRAELTIRSDEALLYDLSNPDNLVPIGNPFAYSASDTDDALAFGISYGKGPFEKGLYAAAVFQRVDSDARTPVVSETGKDIFFNARGSESFASYTWGRGDCYSAYLGHNYLRSGDRVYEEIPIVKKEFRLLQYYLGLQYRWNKNFRFYLEAAFDYSNRVAREEVDNFAALGVRIDI